MESVFTTEVTQQIGLSQPQYGKAVRKSTSFLTEWPRTSPALYIVCKYMLKSIP